MVVILLGKEAEACALLLARWSCAGSNVRQQRAAVTS
uniref:Uncharacterized protein n=1 Tax=Caudovirales sp. ctNZz8 TaxID=2826772 RepID=A0A8S5QYA6_9CAUD|nr:MAG TPA: hypothetical protein [Caudovirales sp. ctNZz8]